MKQLAIEMKQINEPRIRVEIERPRGYGSVPGLSDEELADVAELERMAYLDLWGPLLSLPQQGQRDSRWLKGEAFDTHDFAALYDGFDWRWSRREELGLELRNARIMRDIVWERVDPRKAWPIVRLVRQDVLELEHIEDADIRAAAKWDGRMRALRERLEDLWERPHRGGGDA